jgi:hypothetical protein
MIDIDSIRAATSGLVESLECISMIFAGPQLLSKVPSNVRDI